MRRCLEFTAQYEDFREFGYQSVDTCISILMKIKHPVRIRVFEIITSNGDIIYSFIFPHGLKLNTETFIKYLQKVAQPWKKRLATGRPYVW